MPKWQKLNRQRKNNMETIFVEGFYGAGHKMIAKLLASRKNLKYIDMEDAICDKEKASKDNIINEKGIDYYLNVEKYILKNAIEQGSIVSLDEIMIENEDIRHIIKRTGRVFYLKASPELLYNNLCNMPHNIKILQNDFSILTIKKMLEVYEKYYYELQNYIINIDGKNIDTMLKETLAIYNYLHKIKCHIYM